MHVKSKFAHPGERGHGASEVLPCTGRERFQVGVPEGLEQVLIAAMAAMAEDRHPSAEDFARGLLPFASEPMRSQWAPTLGAS